ncbi:MAG: L-aspartate oxidase [Gammaproteobacteria bacterium]|nr:L-aspartate oxidase [Gammaproteobacteria bacterium]
MPDQPAYDVVVLGAGAAGLSVALRLADRARVALVSKCTLPESNTYYAQGGISAVLDEGDSFDAHIEDTLRAGAGLCHPYIVRKVVEQGPECVDWLVSQGVEFTRRDAPAPTAEYHLTREGGHSHRRVIHVADTTGRAVTEALLAAARRHEGIDILESWMAIDLISERRLGRPSSRCLGVYALDLEAGQVKALAARVVVLATGGAGKTYLYTSNPDVATGDGVAMAWRAGCRIANMEFVQFHPTCLYHPHAKSFLISESVRGEGGRLLLPNGEPFMQRFDERGELAPRDIVARAIDHEMKRLGIDCVYLDISHSPADFIVKHFPNIHARCREFGFDMTREPIPVVPAAHYTCGGVVTDAQGSTDIPALYAIGEVAFTGLHGANRMASNSLLECFAFAQFAARSILDALPAFEQPPPLPPWDDSRVTDSDEEVVVSHNWDELRRFMWDYVGIVRTSKRLQRAKRRIQLLLAEINEYYGNFHVTGDLIELRNLALVADLIIRSAQARRESRGLHFTLDYPQPDPGKATDTVLTPPNYRAAADSAPSLGETA